MKIGRKHTQGFVSSQIIGGPVAPLAPPALWFLYSTAVAGEQERTRQIMQLYTNIINQSTQSMRPPIGGLMLCVL